MSNNQTINMLIKLSVIADESAAFGISDTEQLRTCHLPLPIDECLAPDDRERFDMVQPRQIGPIQA